VGEIYSIALGLVDDDLAFALGLKDGGSDSQFSHFDNQRIVRIGVQVVVDARSRHTSRS
jgi:hypothetical protein